MKGKPVIYKGKEYPNVLSLVKTIYKNDTEKHYRRIYKRLTNGYSLEDAMKPEKITYRGCKPVVYKGKEYLSLYSLIKSVYKKDINTHNARIRKRLKLGYSLEDAMNPEKRKYRESKPIVYKGKKYSSLMHLVKTVYKKDMTKNFNRIYRRLFRSGYSLEDAMNPLYLKKGRKNDKTSNRKH